MRTAVVDNPEDSAGVIVRWASHDLLNESMKRLNASGRFTTAKDAGVVHIKRCQIGPGSTATILVFDSRWLAGARRERGMFSLPRLDAGLLVGRDYEFIVFQGSSLPTTLIQIKDSAGLDSKGGISREDPASVIPRADGVGVEPSPNGATRDGGNQA